MSELITVTGNLAADPERRSTAGGDVVVAFRVGSTQRRFDKEANTWVDAYTNWYHVSAFRSLAEHALRSLRKGDRVIVVGTLRLRTWENDSRSGVTADVDAHAIGPDLRWGTTTFTRAARGAEAPGGVPAEPAPTAHVDADGWALPPAGGSDDENGNTAGPGAAGDPSTPSTGEPALVTAGAPHLADGEETPF
ncbi:MULTISPECIES: single-stranded DNA-binding protein [unclassified Microbacterium]|uniref:single-stranded DNA-binding protein n=1 Tax=unclassified Microbacterium TaxID=2609290 RepID=UPI00214AA340|nr:MULTISPECIES: single-stranded DNA-binding protein [unclassified Microbacterium]MCR2801033.1 single-stranded DNA-binding protein [Microbacterium sp. zg.Y818]MCR2826492.1 single-stranded DNA-binding protein [Microbacterium sp. zg.Y909]WIM23738.1 single-stranded DNA-binding protein [Microbacterium sp. zg-Y818]